jgi:hypothetical protein
MIIKFFQDNNDIITTATNGTAAAIFGFFFCLIIYYLFKLKFSDETDIRTILTGFALVSFGICINRAWWAIVRYYNVFNEHKTQLFFQEYGVFSNIPIAIGISGAVIMVSPFFSRILDIKSDLIKLYNIIFSFLTTLIIFTVFILILTSQSFEKKEMRLKQEIYELQRSLPEQF